MIAVSKNKAYFARVSRKGQDRAEPSRAETVFFVQGVNYIGAVDRPWQLWSQFEPNLIKEDFKKIQEAGLNVVRLFSSPILEKEIRAGTFNKLDRVLQFAADYKLLVLLTLNGSRALNLAAVSALDQKIIDRYQEDPVILGWDLQDNPGLFDLAAAIYPKQSFVPLQSGQLISRYGQQLSQAEAVAQQAQGYLPKHLNARQAYFYANVQVLYQKFLEAARLWQKSHQGTLLDFLDHPEANRWQGLTQAMDETLTIWFKQRHQALKDLDPHHLITTTFQNLHWAGLPANSCLDFISYSQLNTSSFADLKASQANLNSLRQAFPEHPVLMSEFGCPNQKSSNPTLHHPLDDKQSALIEMSQLAYLRAKHFAGGIKWTLNDHHWPDNPQASSYGLYTSQGQAKAAKALLKQSQDTWPQPPCPAQIQLLPAEQTLAFRLRFGQDELHSIFIAGQHYQDAQLSWQAQDIAYLQLTFEENALLIQATQDGQLSLMPWALLPNWDKDLGGALYRLDEEAKHLLWQSDDPSNYHLPLKAQQRYRLQNTGRQVLKALQAEPTLIPNPGEHVLLLGNANQNLRDALPYLRAFAPDISFAPDKVRGRWAYVSVIASKEQIPDSQLAQIRQSGAYLVERLEGDISQIIADLIHQDRRFLAISLNPPPDDSLVTIPSPVQPDPALQAGYYFVRPGDTLRKIAHQFYGQGLLWQFIFGVNLDVLTHPDHLRPGLRLKIPPSPNGHQFRALLFVTIIKMP